MKVTTEISQGHAVRLMGVSRQTLRTLEIQGLIRARRVGRSTMLNVSDLETYQREKFMRSARNAAK